jgi:hypothetical protein
MLLRCIQAAGSASTIAIGSYSSSGPFRVFCMANLSNALGAGVISDIAESKERGGFYGVYTLGPMVRI